MRLIYLDYNCFQRPFDDQSQVRIRLEALACLEIFIRTEANEMAIIWSFMHEDENRICPFPERQYEVLRLSTICRKRVGPEEDVLNLAESVKKQAKLSAKDALHFACALYAEADYFLTCDDVLLKRAGRVDTKMRVMNPVDYIRQEVTS